VGFSTFIKCQEWVVKYTVDIELFITVIRGVKYMSQKASKDDVKALASEVTRILQIMGGDLMRLQTLVYTHLEEEGKIERIVCANCKEELLRPNMKDIEKSDICPHCGGDIYGTEQTTFENWDDGISGEEE
jgi:formylmethanofuran dehydrogenase subunit E